MEQAAGNRRAHTGSMQPILNEFFRRYLLKRDLEGMLSMVSEQILSIGTGEGEVARNKEEFRQLLQREFAALPNPIQYTMMGFEQRERVPGYWNCLCDMETVVTLPEGQQAAYRMRVTADICETDGKYLVDMVHASEASAYMEDGEFLPVKFLSRGVEAVSRETRLDLLEIIGQIMPGGIVGGYLEPGFPLYVANDRLLHMAGYESYEEFAQDIGGLVLNSIHPDDWDFVNAEMDNIPQLGDQYEIQYRMKKKDGSYMWVHDIGRRTLAADGRVAIISVLTDISRQVHLQNYLATEAATDPLTGVLNRKGGQSCVAEKMQQGGSYLFLMLDLDNFKQINDLYGHKEGDRALCAMADQLKERFRKSDMVCRIGGDEFAVFVGDCNDFSSIEGKLERLIADCGRRMSENWPEAHSTLSVGGIWGRKPRAFQELYQMADEVLYEVKRGGKGQHCIHVLDDLP